MSMRLESSSNARSRVSRSVIAVSMSPASIAAICWFSSFMTSPRSLILSMSSDIWVLRLYW